MSSWAVNVRSGSTIARLPCNQRGSMGLSQGLFTGSRHTRIRTPPVRFTVRLCSPIHACTARLTCQAVLSHTSTHTRLPSGRVQREVLGITVSSHRDLKTLLRGFNQAYNGRRQRVLKEQSPERVVQERLGAVPVRANPSHDPPFDPRILPKALQVIARAKDVSHPDSGAALDVP